MKIEDDDDYVYKQKKPHNKLITLISILIVLTIIIVITIVVIMMQIEAKKLAVTVDGKKVEFTEDTFLFTEDTGDVYVSIKDIAPLVGYEAHNGEYKVNSEDPTKAYIEALNGTETTSFYQNSKLINKVAPDSKEDYETVQIGAPVTENNGKLYINAEGFSQGFNAVLRYDKENNKITIQTLPYLVEYYKTNIASYGYDHLSEDFNNQKALVYGMIVASKEATGNYGVVDSRLNKEIIGPRYKEIKFIESSEEFIITNSSEKVGIAHATGETKINVQYDDIKVLDSKRGYYLVESLSKFGVINASEELIIHIEYDKIGVDTSEFPSDNIGSQYVLYDKVIPVSLNGKWGLFDVEGKKIAEPEYDTIGCINDELTDKVVNNAMTIGESNVIVVSKDKLYGGISTKGDMLLPLMFDYIYSITSGGETTYYMARGDVSYKALDLINAMKLRLGGYEEELEEEKKKQNNEQNPNQTPTPTPSESPEMTTTPTEAPENNTTPEQ